MPEDDPNKTIDAVDPAGAPAPQAGDTDRPDYPTLPTVETQHYVIGDAIASGGMGRVVSARDRRLGRVVAIKELLPKNRANTRRFEREARITAGLQHPAIIHVYEAGRWPGGEPFYAMTKVDGRSLDRVVAERATLAERLGLLRNVIAAVDALAYAHDRGVIHRDLKPSNVLVGAFGDTVVIDWGLAKQRGDDEPVVEAHTPGDAKMTAHGSVVGTPAYMPLEQARGEAVDERADVYALGALLYHVLSGAAPYTGERTADVLAQVLAEPPPRMREREPGVPIDLAAIVDKAMARERAARYPTAKELADDLQRFATGRLVAAHHYSLPHRLVRWVRRNAVAVAVAAVAIGVLSVGATVSVRRILDARAVADAQRAEAESRRTALLVEQGRAQLEVGRAGRALAYLAAAYERGDDGPVNRFLIAEAMRPFTGELAKLRVGSAVLAVAWSPDGSRLATASDSGRVSIWRSDGTFVADLMSFHNRVRAIAFDRDGSHLLVRAEEPLAMLWDIGARKFETLAHYPQGVEPMTLRSNTPELATTAGQWMRDGRILTAGKDGIVRVWDVKGAEVHRITAGEPVVVARASGDARRVIAATEHRVAIWTLDRATLEAADGVTLEGTTSAVDAQFLPDGASVIVATGDRLTRADATSGARLASARFRAAVEHVEVSPDGARVLITTADRGVRVLDPTSLEVAFEIEHHDEQLLGAAFSPDGTTVATHSRDGSVRLWDARRGTHLGWFEGHGAAVHAVAFSPDGRRLLTGGADLHARLWDASTTVAHATAIELPAPAVTLAGTAVAREDGAITLWDPTTARADELALPACGLALSPDGSRLAAAGAREVAIVDVRSRRRDATLPAAKACAIAYGADGIVATGGEDGIVRLWRDGALLRQLVAHRAPVRAVAFDPAGTRVVSSGDDATAIVWEVATGTHLAVFTGRGPLRAVAFHPNGRAIAAAGGGHVAIYALDPSTPIALDGTPGVVASLAFTPDGSRLVTGGEDGAIRVWNAANGRLLATHDVHAAAVRGIAIAADGTRGWSASLDRRVATWHLETTTASAAEVAQLVAAHVPWRLEDDLVVARVEARPAIAVGTEFATHAVPIGAPAWEIVGATQYAARVGGTADGFAGFEDMIRGILPKHTTAKLVSVSKEPHPPPYDDELASGLARMGTKSGTRFTLADWTPPYQIGVLAMVAAKPGSATGTTADGVVAMVPDAVCPLAFEATIERDGIVVDSDFNITVPAASDQDPRWQGHSHALLSFATSLDYMRRELGTGTYVWRARILDQTGQGYDIAFGPLIVTP